MYTMCMDNNIANTYSLIRVLSEATGVGSSTLRARERCYGLLKPMRIPKQLSLALHLVEARVPVQRLRVPRSKGARK